MRGNLYYLSEEINDHVLLFLILLVGKAGQLLDKALLDLGLDLNKDIYVCNIIKCRPPGNRKPMDKETDKSVVEKVERSWYLYPKDLLVAFKGKTGVWIVYSAPTRDERGSSYVMGYYEGLFENVLSAAKKLRGFMDCDMCGKILPMDLIKV